MGLVRLARPLAVLAVGAISAACGGTPAASTRSPGSSTEASASSAPPTASAAWNTYHDVMVGYSIQYPGNWLDVSHATGDVAGARSFSNEMVTDNRLTGLDEKGVVFRVAVAPLDGRCIPGGYENRPFTPFTASVDGESGLVAGYDSSPPADPESNVFIHVGHSNRCYMFTATTRSAATRDSFIPLFLQMLSTFRFGSGS